MKNNKIILKNNNGFKWYKDETNIFAKGYAFYQNKLFKESELLQLLTNVRTEENFSKLIKELNGSFILILETSDIIVGAVDRLRSMPLFYSYINGQLLISDVAEQLREELNIVSLDEHKVREMLLTCYTLNESTLLSDVKQIQAGEYIIYEKKNNKFKREFYYHHLHRNYTDEIEDTLFQKLNDISLRFTERLIASINNRTIVVPLSGGYDSRYIVAMLKYLNYKNVIAYSYGTKNSYEIDVARKVAKALDIEWHNIEYNYTTWKKFYDSSLWSDYSNYASNYSSVPHLQDFYAIWELTKNEIIPANSVIVPGFCGDLLGGSYIPQELIENKKDKLIKDGLTKYIFNRHFNISRPRTNDYHYMSKEIDKCISNLNLKIYNIEEFVSANESFFTKHKVAKYVVNALRVYDYFNYEWRMPLWDNELMEFWYQIPVQYKINKTLYEKHLFNFIFNPHSINFYKKSLPKTKISQIRSKIPYPIKRVYRFIKKSIDVDVRYNGNINASYEANSIIYKDLHKKKKFYRYDYSYELWSNLFIQTLQEKLRNYSTIDSKS